MATVVTLQGHARDQGTTVALSCQAALFEPAPWDDGTRGAGGDVQRSTTGSATLTLQPFDLAEVSQLNGFVWTHVEWVDDNRGRLSAEIVGRPARDADGLRLTVRGVRSV